jgi:hypothetical protein
MTNIDPRAYDSARAAKREAIAARLREEKAERVARQAAARAENDRLWVEESFRRAQAGIRRRAMGGIPCHHGGYFDSCHTCQAEALAERDAEAQANL